MRLLDAAAVRERLPFAALIAALRDGFAACDIEAPPRHAHAVGDGATMLLMPAWRRGGLLGVKTIHIVPANAARGLATLHGLYQLYDAATGVPLAVLDAGELTARRTAATAALAASLLARADARRLLVVGAGRIAALLPEALRAVRPIDTVEIWNLRPAGAVALASRVDGGRAVTDLDAAVARADIVCCATPATTPLVRGVSLRPGTHVDLAGSFAPAMCEADAQALAGARVFIDVPEALAKAGELLQPGVAPARVDAALADIVRAPPRRDDADVTVFKHVGSAVADLAAGALASR